MLLTSPAFEDDQMIPSIYTCDADNFNPPLEIKDVPEKTKSLALIMDDPDAMGAVGKVWVHWVVWNIDPNNTKFQENSIASNCIEGETDFGEIGYGGPAPPDKEHTYIFKLYALDKKLENSKGSTKKQIEDAMNDHIIAETKLEGRYAP